MLKLKLFFLRLKVTIVNGSRKIDREIRRPMDRNKLSGPHQWDKVRDLTDAERITPLNTIDDLVNNNSTTIHGNPGNGRYRPEDFTPNSAYVNVNMDGRNLRWEYE